MENNALTLNGFFNNYDFSTINGTIENLASANTELTDAEKKMAIDVISEWESCVVRNINNNADNIRTFISFFNSNDSYYWNSISAEKKNELAAITNTMELYEEILALEEKIDNLEYEKPEAYVDDIDESNSESLIKLREYELEKAKYDIKMKRLMRSMELLKRNWKRQLNLNKNIKEAIAAASKIRKNTESILSECRQKGQIAKLNVSISSESIRNSLKDLINFSSEI